MRLEDLRPRCAVRGVHPDGVVTVVNAQWFGSEAVELTYKTPSGAVANELLYRHEPAYPQSSKIGGEARVVGRHGFGHRRTRSPGQ